MPKIRITVDGQLAYTVEQAAAQYGHTPSSMRTVLARLKQAGDAAATPVDMLDGHKPLYDAGALDRAMDARPGRGANLRARGGRLPDPGLAAVCAACGEPRQAHGGSKHLGACPGHRGVRAQRFQLQEPDKDR